MRAAAVGIAVALGLGLTAPVASADTPGCTSQFWMMGLRAATRTICDGPLAPNGSWTRTRSFTAPAFVADGTSVCYGYGFCTFTMPRQVAAIDVLDRYPVTADTVLPDEPPYLGTGRLS